jgi:hypothetical protein
MLARAVESLVEAVAAGDADAVALLDEGLPARTSVSVCAVFTDGAETGPEVETGHERIVALLGSRRVHE